MYVLFGALHLYEATSRYVQFFFIKSCFMFSRFPDHYVIPHGIFLFLGYSEEDEAKLKPHNNLSAQDAADSLQEIMAQMDSKVCTFQDLLLLIIVFCLLSQRSCTLDIFNMTRENMILVAHPARLTNTSKTSDLATLGKVSQTTKIESNFIHLILSQDCIEQLQNLSMKINNRDPEVSSHIVLSMLKLAEVEIKVPEVSSSAPELSTILTILLISFTTLQLTTLS